MVITLKKGVDREIMKSNPKVLPIGTCFKSIEKQVAVLTAVIKTFLVICLSNNQVLSEMNNYGSYGKLIAYNAQYPALGTYYGICRVMIMKEKVYDNFHESTGSKKGVVEQLTIVTNDTPFYDGRMSVHTQTRFKKHLHICIYEGAKLIGL
ncbi:MAG: hypothetical protein U9O20_03950 [Patescibacteria group bacterium]|nr:hypothetical protein [Patescibacteria group bacterium]